jgi:hypothetical protein
MKSTRANGYEYWMNGVRATCPKCYYKSLSHIRPFSNWVYCASDQCDWAGDFTEGLVHKDSPNVTRRNIRFIYLPYLTRSNTQDPHSGIKAPAWLLGLKEEKI